VWGNGTSGSSSANNTLNAATGVSSPGAVNIAIYGDN